MKELLKDLKHQSAGHQQAITTVILRVSMVDPLTYQAVLKFRDNSIAWCVGCDPDPSKALAKAYEKVDGSQDPKPPFYLKRKQAEDLMEGLLEIYGPHIARSDVELEPFQGWCVVLRPKPGREAKLAKLVDKVRIDHEPQSFAPERQANAVGQRETKPKASSSSVAPTISRTEMERIWKEKTGKQPNRRLKKDDLFAAMVEKGYV